ncbi:hypothetical protein L1987_01027 [Smallanthus sonchifolius]|uniref:Uncharacterized protein n=1 Tax=Smallanthus sonchifolius TaxID=185202 RepID=A0ACB9K3R1_9ASTR|nr:hypothetical protein L1987_01027 [Smallanthus sonchifolius]
MNDVRKYHHANPKRLVDFDIRDQVDNKSLLAYIEVAYKCISFNLKDRPSMNTIVKTIEKLLSFQMNGSASTSSIRSIQAEKIEDFKIPLEVIKMATEDFSSETHIGYGGFGIVYKGELSERWQNRTAAIKRLKEAGNDEFHKELQLIFNFSHENIIPFIGYCDEENEMIIVTEYRPRNQATDTGLYTGVGGTEYYIDPVYRESGKLRTASDVYSFGVVLFEMLSGILAYNPIKSEDGGKLQMLINIVRRYKGALPDELMDPFIKDEIDYRSFFPLQDIAYECINLNYMKRPTMDTIIDRIEEALEYQVNHKILSKAD